MWKKWTYCCNISSSTLLSLKFSCFFNIILLSYSDMHFDWEATDLTSWGYAKFSLACSKYMLTCLIICTYILVNGCWVAAIALNSFCLFEVPASLGWAKRMSWFWAQRGAWQDVWHGRPRYGAKSCPWGGAIADYTEPVSFAVAL